MIVLGITGPTGAGKTTLLHEVEDLACAVIDCDAVYHQMLERNITLQNALENAFGPLRDEEGRIDRKKLGAVVFRDPVQLERLNAIAQTAVVSCTQMLIDEYRRQQRAMTAVDAIALLESPLRELCDVTVAVLAPAEVRVRRIMAREGISEDYAWSRVKAQKPDEFYIRGCDCVLVNDCASAEEFAQKAREFLLQIHESFDIF